MDEINQGMDARNILSCQQLSVLPPHSQAPHRTQVLSQDERSHRIQRTQHVQLQGLGHEGVSEPTSDIVLRTFYYPNVKCSLISDLLNFLCTPL